MNTQYIRVESMTSRRSNRAVANQFMIYAPEGVYFQSYNTIIAFAPRPTGNIILDENSWDYSRTTLKYLGQFLTPHTSPQTKRDIEKRISEGVYKLANLN